MMKLRVLIERKSSCKQGLAFRKLVLRARPLILSGLLREVVKISPDSLLYFSNVYTVVVNEMKASLEKYTGAE